MNNLRKRLEQEIGLSDYKVTRTIEIFLSEGFTKKVNTKKTSFTKRDFKNTLIQLGCEPQHVEDWMKVRTTKKGSFTKTALTRLINECDNNMYPVPEAVKICAENDWRGFKYEWVINLKGGNKVEESRTGSMAREVLRRAGVEYK